MRLEQGSTGERNVMCEHDGINEECGLECQCPCMNCQMGDGFDEFDEIDDGFTWTAEQGLVIL